MIRHLFLLLGLVAFAQTEHLPPAPTAHVTDPQRFLSEGARQEITLTLQQLESNAPCQAIVWIGHLPPNATKETFANQAFKAWGIGHQGVKDGVALFVFPKTKGLRIEVGYGLEGRLTDLDCGRILREEVSPRLKAGDRDGAIKAGVEGIRATLMKSAVISAPLSSPQPAPAQEEMPDWMILLLIGGGFILFIWLLVKWSRWNATRPRTYSSNGSSTGWWDSSSSSSSSSGGSWFDSSSSSSSGGGFFDSFSGGGGDSGGGGASGDW